MRIGYALNRAFESGKSFLFTRFILNPSKEITKSLMNPIRNILGNLRMNRIFTLNQFIIVKFSKGFIFCFVGIYRDFKKFIIDCLADFKRINQSFFLFVRKIQTYAVS